MEDYTKYLSIDNGHGILLSSYDVSILDRFHIDYLDCLSIKDLMVRIEDELDNEYDEELDDVLNHLSELHYYHEVNK